MSLIASTTKRSAGGGRKDNSLTATAEVRLLPREEAAVSSSLSASSRPDRWTEGLVNNERLKQLFPFLDEDEGYF
jgi:hypothetical protein